MNKMKLIYNAIKWILKEPGFAPSGAIKAGKEGRALKYAKNIMEKGFPTVNMLDLLPELDETITPYTYLSGGSMVTDLALVKGLAKKIRNCTYLEIGVWRGESMAAVAKSAKECVSLSLSDEQIKKLTNNDNFVAQNKIFLNEFENILFIEANSLTYDFENMNKKFDLIFIDADHSWAAVKSDTINAFKLLKDENSIIVWHDYGLTPEEKNWPTVAGIIDGCPQEYRKYLYHVSNTKCAIFIKKEMATRYEEFPVIPDKIFEVNIKAKKYIRKVI